LDLSALPRNLKATLAALANVAVARQADVRASNWA